ncbi:MAG: hypothetical protein K1X89_25985 [Myxococcaceae bacterium]|nr:hypothetical protein [Myxococcaceae bacterium]
MKWWVLCVVTLGTGCTVKVAELTCARCEEPDRPCGSGLRCVAGRCQPADRDVACEGSGGGAAGGGQGGGAIEPEDAGCQRRTCDTPGCVATLGDRALGPYQGGPLASARFGHLVGLAARSDGTLFLSDDSNHVVWRVDPAATTVSLAQGTPGVCADLQPNTDVLCHPGAISLTDGGVLFGLDRGTGALFALADGGPQLKARFTKTPWSLTNVSGFTMVMLDQDFQGFDESGASLGKTVFYTPSFQAESITPLYFDGGFALVGSERVGTVENSHFDLRAGRAGYELPWGDGFFVGHVDGALRSAARFMGVWGTAPFQDEVLLTERYSHTLRTVDGTAVATLQTGAPMDGLGELTALATSGSRFWCVEEDTRRLLRFDQKGAAVTVLTPTAPPPGACASRSSFAGARGVAVEPGTGRVVVADTRHHALRFIDASGAVTSLGDVKGYQQLKPGVMPRFDSPAGLRFRANGHLVVADTGNGLVRELDLAAGTETLLAGCLAGTVNCSADVEDPELTQLPGVLDFAETADGGLLFVARGVDRLVFMRGGRTLASIDPGSPDPKLSPEPRGVEFANGLVYLTSAHGETVKAFDPDTSQGDPDLVQTWSFAPTYCRDSFRLCRPSGIRAVGSRIFTALEGADVVVELLPDGGTRKVAGVVDGPGVDGRLFSPWALASDGDGGLYVTELDGPGLRYVRY